MPLSQAYITDLYRSIRKRHLSTRMYKRLEQALLKRINPVGQ